MLKINYPEDRSAFNQTYLTVFDKKIVNLSCRFNYFLDNTGLPLKNVLVLITHKGELLNEATFLEYNGY